MKIVVLTSETPANIWLVNRLLSQHDVVGMVIERPPLALTAQHKQERRRRMFQRYGRLRTLNKLLYNLVRSRYLAPKEAVTVKEQLFPDGASIAYARHVPTQTVANINDAACIEFIKRLGPKVLAVCGTTVIRPEVFSLPPRGTINIHTGITPEYRSADPIFWALHQGEPHRVGVTIHFVDQGIDTGPIIRQEAVPVYADDSLATIYIRCIHRGAELYSQALSDLERGVVRTLDRSGARNRAFHSIDLGIVQYVLFLLRFQRLSLRLRNGETRVHEVRK